MSEYINVTEFAERAGVSKQAVYKRMKKDLNQFTQMVDGVACINIGALELFKVDKIEEKSTEQPTVLDNLVEQLKKELEHKNQMIDRLQERNDQLQAENFRHAQHSREQSEKQSERWFDMMEQNNNIQKNSQMLLAQIQVNNQDLLDKQQEVIQQIQQAQTIDTTIVQEANIEKKGFFGRIFGK